MKILVSLLILSSAIVLAQAEDSKLVTVEERYLSKEAIAHAVAPKSAEWIGIGKEIGIATKEGLTSVVDVAEKFGSSKVGHFVMFMIAWKIIGHQMLAVALGIPIWFLGVGLWVWLLRRFFFGVRVVKSYDAVNKIKTFETLAYKWQGEEAKCTVACTFVGVFVGWTLIWVATIFWV